MSEIWEFGHELDMHDDGDFFDGTENYACDSDDDGVDIDIDIDFGD